MDVDGIAMREHAEGTLLSVKARPGARKNAIMGTHGSALRVSVIAPPEDGKANLALAALLAESLGLRAAAVTLNQGASNANKWFLIRGVTPDVLREKIKQLPIFTSGG